MIESQKERDVVRLLEMAAAGKLDSAVALEQWPDIDSEEDALIAAGWHELSHFANDGDIRDRDKEYDEYQRNSLCEYARKIREKYALGEAG